MGKVIKIIRSFISAAILALIVLPVALSLLLYLPWIQDFARRAAAGFLSDKLQTVVSVDKLHLKLFSRVTLDGFYVQDYHGDTLLYAGRIVVPLQSPVSYTHLDVYKRQGSDGASEEESGFKSEVFVKSGVISVKDEVAAMSTPKILGKIDLSGGRSGRLSSSEKKPESPKKPAAASEISASSVPAADVKPVEPSQPVRPPVAVAEQPAPSPRPEQPVTAPVVVQSQTYDERVAADQSNLFRPEEGARLSGPKVLGKIDVQLSLIHI